ncbi:hypothetical protein M378DRAFT_346146 [Amanita muscaria Koide BX008]|uniref:Uncharacterized protein n=1 Tax=Amanita muscaria (strain Koide BX008) TaxID=946122 RepID=A0A0C2WP99_AMAMK|nr:hypothetical protein M378DRAFT_346146 [Amanita muscaria Koide BX008]
MMTRYAYRQNFPSTQLASSIALKTSSNFCWLFRQDEYFGFFDINIKLVVWSESLFSFKSSTCFRFRIRLVVGEKVKELEVGVQGHTKGDKCAGAR